jgi:hypothetical protein
MDKITISLLLVGWFPANLPALVETLNAEVLRVDVSGLASVSPYAVEDASLEADGIHLTAAAGSHLLKTLGLFISEVLNGPFSADAADTTLVHVSDVSDVESAGDSESVVTEPSPGTDTDRLESILRIVQGNSRLLGAVRPLTSSVAMLSRRADGIEAQVRLRRQQDNLVFARIKEDSDSEINRSREDRVVISGLDRALDGAAHSEKKIHYKAVVDKLVSAALPDLDPAPTVIDLTVTFRRDQVSPVVEAKFQDSATASSFRKAAAALAKAKVPDFASLFFSNSVTQATRVRIEIMRAISKKLTTDSETAYVQGFTSRPIMHYVVKDSMVSHCSGTGRGYTFADAVSRFGDLLCPADLSSAYKRAGSTFHGAMEQYFVVLKEGVLSSSNQEPLGHRNGTRGRPRSGAPQRGGPRLSRGAPSSSLSVPGSRKRALGHSAETPSKRKPDNDQP